MGFSGGGSNVLKPHTHDGTIVQDGGALNANNITQMGMSAGDVMYSDGNHLQILSYPGVPAGEKLTAAPASTAPTWGTAGGATVTTATSTMSGTFTSSSLTLVDIGLSIVKPNIAGGKCLTTVFLSCENNGATSCTFAIEDNGVVVSRMDTNKSNVTTDYCGNITLSDVSDADGNTIEIQGMGLAAGNWTVRHTNTYAIPKVVCFAVG